MQVESCRMSKRKKADLPGKSKEPIAVVIRRRKKPAQSEYALLQNSELFDADWYLATNRDVAEARVDPIEHYLDKGGIEGRPASKAFHSAGYFALHIDIARAGLNPLVHYLTQGRAEGRQIMSIGDFLKAFGDEARQRRLREFVMRVARSPLYDPSWMLEHYPDLLSRLPHPIASFLPNSSAPLTNPGPKFDCKAYLQNHVDVAQKAFAPFLHYILSGEAEGRTIFSVPQSELNDARTEVSVGKTEEPTAPTGEIDAALERSEQAAVDLIRSSPLFDAAWYVTQYNDVARAGIDPAIHYLRHGAVESRRPSVYFDPDFYVSQKPNFSAEIPNPLVHFLTKGRAAGLKPSALVHYVAPSRKLLNELGTSNPLVTVSSTSAAPRIWTKYRDISPVAGEQLIFFGTALLGRVEDLRKLKSHSQPLIEHLRLLRADSANLRTRSVNTGRESVLDTKSDAMSYRGFGPLLRGGAATISDIWSPAEGHIRLRLGQRVEGNSKSVKLMVLRAFQSDFAEPTRPALVGEGPVGTDPSLIDLTLNSPFAPILLVLSTADGVVIEFGHIPFPSLVRGGAHSGEVTALGERSNSLDSYCGMADALVRESAGWNLPEPAESSVRSIRVRLEGALGTEKIFSADVREWLLAVFGIAVEGMGAQGMGGDFIATQLNTQEGIRSSIIARAERRTTGATMVLPADTLPTLSALVSRRLYDANSKQNLIGSFIVADHRTGRARSTVSFPAFPADLQSLQPTAEAITFPILASVDDENSKLVGRTQLPIAIRYPVIATQSNAVLLTPEAPDSTRAVLRCGTLPARKRRKITILLLGADQLQSGKAIMAASLQQGAEIVDVIACASGTEVSCNEELNALYPARFVLQNLTGHLNRDLALAAEQAAGDHLLLLNGATILHDSRTLETLENLLAHDRIASVSCAMLSEVTLNEKSSIRTSSAGYFPTSLSLASMPQITLAKLDVFEALASATYPVLANDFDCTLVRKDVLLKYASAYESTLLGPRFPLHFSLASARDGWHHLCTTAVRATSVDARKSSDEIDPVGANFLNPGRWQEISEVVTLVREFH
jgi:hypothetical protein